MQQSSIIALTGKAMFEVLQQRTRSFSHRAVLFHRIVELSLLSVPDGGVEQASLFFDQFPNLRFLHVGIENRRLADERVVATVSGMISKFPSLIYLKLQLLNKLHLATAWDAATNARVKRLQSNMIFDGVLLHFWF